NSCPKRKASSQRLGGSHIQSRRIADAAGAGRPRECLRLSRAMPSLLNMVKVDAYDPTSGGRCLSSRPSQCCGGFQVTGGHPGCPEFNVAPASTAVELHRLASKDIARMLTWDRSHDYILHSFWNDLALFALCEDKAAGTVVLARGAGRG